MYTKWLRDFYVEIRDELVDRQIRTKSYNHAVILGSLVLGGCIFCPRNSPAEVRHIWTPKRHTSNTKPQEVRLDVPPRSWDGKKTSPVFLTLLGYDDTLDLHCTPRMQSLSPRILADWVGNSYVLYILFLPLLTGWGADPHDTTWYHGGVYVP